MMILVGPFGPTGRPLRDIRIGGKRMSLKLLGLGDFRGCPLPPPVVVAVEGSLVLLVNLVVEQRRQLRV